MGYLMKPKEIELNERYDIIVVGGGPSGCAAAIAAARKGARTLLIEATGSLGGAGTMGLLPAWTPFSDMEKIIYKGIAEEIFCGAKIGLKHVKKEDTDWVPIDPERLKIVYDEKIVEAGVDVLFNTMLSDVDAENGEVNTIIVSNKSGLTAYKAKVYIDCTGDADLAAWAGAEVLENEEKNTECQATSLCFEITNVDLNEYYNGEVLYAGNRNSPIHDIVSSGKFNIPDTHMCNNEVYPGTVGFNAGHLWNVNSTDPWSISQAMIKGRRLAHEIRRALSEYHPKAFGNSKVSLTAPIMVIRETRRIKGDYILTKEDYLGRRTFEDEICRNSYFLDVHRRFVSKVSTEKRVRKYEKGESYGIPYRCLTPVNLKNVLVAGKCISTESVLQGSTRAMPICLCMGEAAGKAAVIAKNMDDIDIHKIDVNLLRQQIIDDGGYIQAGFKQKELVKITKDFIERNIDKKISIADIANSCFVNSIYLSRVFKKNTGITIHTYLENYRVNVAKKYLVTNKSIEEIAIECGYSSVKYFSECFKKIVGVSPMKYKKDNK